MRIILTTVALLLAPFALSCAMPGMGAPSGSSAVCVLQGTEGHEGISGVVHFTQRAEGVLVEATVHGLTPGSHGFHVHEWGDVSAANGKSAGGHFNPEGMPHGAPESAQRHVGDLGNLEAGPDGTAHYRRLDSEIALRGPHSILGRAIIVHAAPDDFGQPTGHAGARVASGVIGLGAAR